MGSLAFPAGGGTGSALRELWYLSSGTSGTAGDSDSGRPADRPDSGPARLRGSLGKRRTLREWQTFALASTEPDPGAGTLGLFGPGRMLLHLTQHDDRIGPGRLSDPHVGVGRP